MPLAHEFEITYADGHTEKRNLGMTQVTVALLKVGEGVTIKRTKLPVYHTVHGVER